MSAAPQNPEARPASIWHPNSDWLLRPLFGLLLAAAAIGALWLGDPLALFIALITVAAAREWHRMISPGGYVVFWLTTGASLLGALGCAIASESALSQVHALAWIALAIGVVANAGIGFAVKRAPLWHAAGVLYLGVPAVLLFGLRMEFPQGVWVVIGVFLAIWATDTGALFAGNLLRGPKLWPSISPNKTWAGFFGGVFAAAVVEATYVAVLGGEWSGAAVFGALLAVVAHAGDLFESWVKRHFGRKDSGHLIPGHGGVLDRIDSTLFVVPVAAFASFVFAINPLFGANP